MSVLVFICTMKYIHNIFKEIWAARTLLNFPEKIQCYYLKRVALDAKYLSNLFCKFVPFAYFRFVFNVINVF